MRVSFQVPDVIYQIVGLVKRGVGGHDNMMFRRIMLSRTMAVSIFVLFGLYSLLFYRLFKNALVIDFYSFYAASQALIHDHNPYKPLFTTYLSKQKELNANINPPVLLLLYYPLTVFGYTTGLWIWSCLSALMGVGTSLMIGKIVFPEAIFKQIWGYLLLFSFVFFPTLINFLMGQLGSAMAFLLILGYGCYLKRYYCAAGIVWGGFIATKLFPGLLFIFALKMRCYRLFWVMAVVVILLFLIPALLYGAEPYVKYLAMLPKVGWYGDNWNASLYGFLFRWWGNLSVGRVHTILLLLAVVGYFFIKEPSDQRCTHSAFCLVIIMMLVFSPFAWVYYFPMLLLPLAVLYWRMITYAWAPSVALMSLLSLFMVNFPITHIEINQMGAIAIRMSFFSLPFYGVLLLGYLNYKTSRRLTSTDETAVSVRAGAVRTLSLPIVVILSLGVVSVGYMLIGDFLFIEHSL